MNISTTKTELQKAFSKLVKTSQTKTQTPLINYTYISAGAHGVVLHSTDMEVGIKTVITASVNSNGEGLFPTSEVNDIISDARKSFVEEFLNVIVSGTKMTRVLK